VSGDSPYLVRARDEDEDSLREGNDSLGLLVRREVLLQPLRADSRAGGALLPPLDLVPPRRPCRFHSCNVPRVFPARNRGSRRERACRETENKGTVF